MHLAAQHSKLNMVQFLLYRGLTANCRNIHNQSPDVVVGEKTRCEAEKKSNKKIRHILQENGKLQKKLAKHYKGTLSDKPHSLNDNILVPYGSIC